MRTSGAAARYARPMRRRLSLWISVLATLGVAVAAASACDIPIGAIRRSPPTGIEARLAAARAPAPDFTLEGTSGTFRLADALAKGHVLLVFYRGHW
jgi:hypothetical protein